MKWQYKFRGTGSTQNKGTGSTFFKWIGSLQNNWNGSGKIKWIGSTHNKLTGSSSFRNGSDSQELAV